jgi:LPXTG-motif cell wall-anchored protein
VLIQITLARASLPYTGSSSGRPAGVAAGLLGVGALLLVVTRRRSASA